MVSLDSKRLESWLKLGIALIALVLLNSVLNKFDLFFRLDLTEDKRYSISSASKEILQNLNDRVYLEVYLDGDLPAGFRRLQKAIEETLQEFKVYAGKNLQYNFVDPETAKSQNARNEFFNRLAKGGIQPTNVYVTEEGKRIQKLIFPGAEVSYGGRTGMAMLLKGNRTATAQERLNQSIEGVEYELISAINSLILATRKKVAFLTSHGALDSLEIAGIVSSLAEKYDVSKIDITRRKDLSGFDAIILAKPTETFSKLDQFKVDQFIMDGGKAMLFLDALRVNMDSAGVGTIALPYELGLEDLLFRYGVRINHDLVQDLNSGTYPVVTGNFGDQPQIGFLPWPFHPLILSFGKISAVRNLDVAILRFASTIDTVKATGIKKTPMMLSSEYSRVLSAPVDVSFDDFRDPPPPELFNSGYLPTAYLLEGNFSSAFKNRILPSGVDKDQFKTNGKRNKVLVVADGDFIRNEVNVETGQPLELGVEQFSKNRYANEEFVLNMMDYMLEEGGLIKARSKEVKLRPLDQVKVDDEKLKWQMLNLLLPLVLIVIFGLSKAWMRKRKYSNFSNAEKEK